MLAGAGDAEDFTGGDVKLLMGEHLVGVVQSHPVTWLDCNAKFGGDVTEQGQEGFSDSFGAFLQGVARAGGHESTPVQNPASGRARTHHTTFLLSLFFSFS